MSKIILLTLLLASNVALARKVILVLDGGLKTSIYNQYKESFCGPAINNQDAVHAEHGSNISGFLAKHIDNKIYCIQHYTIYNAGGDAMRSSVQALNYAKKNAKDIFAVNISSSGGESSAEERTLINELIEGSGMIFVVSAGNDSSNVINKGKCLAFPACYNDKIFIVGSKRPSTNTGDMVDVYMDKSDIDGMKGTSQAAAYLTLKITQKIKEKKWISYL